MRAAEGSGSTLRAFEPGEHESRLARTKASMAAAGMDLLVLASPANQFWLTGYDGQSYYTPQAVVVSLDRDEPIWFGRKMDAVGARFTAYMGESSIIPYPDEYVGSRERHPLEHLAGLLRGWGWGAKRIGVETDDYYYTARWDAVLRAGLPDARFTDAFLLVNWLRLRKSPAEIAVMREAGRLSAHALRAAIETAAIGVRQCDVMGAMLGATVAGPPDLGGAFPCKPPNAMVNEYAAAPHLTWTDEPLREGDVFYIEQGGARFRYHSPLSRCVHMGRPPQAMLDMTAVVVEGLEAALAAAKPGATCGELDAAWRAVAARHGIRKEGRLGYPVGIGYPPTWGELTCSLRVGDATELEPGMTFHAIPALWMETHGIVVSETFVVTETGAEALADLPRQLFVRSD